VVALVSATVVHVRVDDDLSCLACEREEDSTHTVRVPSGAPIAIALRAAFIAAKADVLRVRYEEIFESHGEQRAEHWYALAWERIAPRGTDDERAACVHSSWCRVTRH
jgi:hypothetical protein